MPIIANAPLFESAEIIDKGDILILRGWVKALSPTIQPDDLLGLCCEWMEDWRLRGKRILSFDHLEDADRVVRCFDFFIKRPRGWKG